MSSERRKRILAGIGGFVLGLAAVALLGVAGILRITGPGSVHPRPSPEQLEGYDLVDEGARVQSLTFRGAWFDVELRVRYDEEWFVVEKFGRGRQLLAKAMRSSGRKYAPDELGGSFLILQTGKPEENLRWKMYLELDTPDGRHDQQWAAVLSYSDLEHAAKKLDRATPAGGDRKIGLLGVQFSDPAKKPIAVELVCRPIDVTAVRAEDRPEQK
jgi:hypothetical protein